MRIGVLGTGVVAETVGAALVARGHEVRLGSRATPHERADAWVAATGSGASAGTFDDAAAFGELLVNCTAGVHSLEALRLVAPGRMSGKVLVDVANPLDFSRGFPPRLAVAPDDSLAEQIQRAFPEVSVVKALNTMTASVMVDPRSLSEPTDVFVAGDDDEAKAQVVALLGELGWPAERVRDLGGLEAARATEAYVMLWLTLMGSIGSAEFNVRVVTADGQP